MTYYISKTKGDPIAINKHDGNSIIYKLSTEKDNMKVDNMYQYVDQEQLRKIAKGLKAYDLSMLEKAVLLNNRPMDERLARVYDEIIRLVGDQKDREIATDYGDFIPYPKRNDILLLLGATGSGKSTSIRLYLIEFKRLYPEVKNIYLFTDNVEEDPVLAGLGIKKIKIDRKLVDNPIKPIELKDSVVIFDDVDSIQDKEILKAITFLKGSCAKQGVSKCGITCIITNHNATENMSTKSAINEAKYIYIYPQGGTTGLNYLLRTKLGLDKEQYMKITQCKSRVVILHKRFPWYVIHSHGLFLL